MAKAKSSDSSRSHLQKARKKRPGIHSKCKSSLSKKAKHYKKSYKSQGR
jgi:hypothetical protein